MTQLDATRAYLDALDLDYISQKMASPHYPLPRWPLELAKTCEKLYKRYLWLIASNPGTPLTPSLDIDEFWHNHILYTENYARDCRAIFGHYLHHTPGDPDNEAEVAKFSDNFLTTKTLYEAEFGEPLLVLARD